jgi:hypothetical protein
VVDTVLVVDGTIGVPSTVRKSPEDTSIGAIGVLLPLALVESNGGAVATESVAVLVNGVGGDKAVSS